MGDRIISVSGAPYDGHRLEAMLESVARVGFTHFEPAFIIGYTEPFDESAFTADESSRWRKAIAAAGLSCHAFSSHIDLGAHDADEIFSRRMEFASSLGAKIISTNAAPRDREVAFLRNIEPLLKRAERLDLTIALENPGDGSDNLINTAADGIALLGRFASSFLRLNYDAANTASHRPEMQDFAADAIRALPFSAHVHIKDVIRKESGWYFAPIGDGQIDCVRLVAAISRIPGLPVSVELPMRLHRDATAKPVRNVNPVPLPSIEQALARSVGFVRHALAQ